MDIEEVYSKFPTQEDCVNLLEFIRWNNKPTCPYCKSQHVTRTQKKRFHCNNCYTAFSVFVNTIFHNTRLPFQKWLLAIWYVLEENKDISVRQLSRILLVNKNTAWYLLMRIQKAITQTAERQLLIEIIEFEKTLFSLNSK